MALTKKQELAKLKKQKDILLKRIAEEREKVKGYEEIAALHCAYVSVLLKKLGATKDNAVTISNFEVKKALTNYEARAIPAEDGWSLYCEVIEE